MVERLPLFPLGQPLFPGITLNLQIFEQRYLSLVRNSVREDSAFGIVAIAYGSEVASDVGTEEGVGAGSEIRSKAGSKASAPLEIFDYGLAVKIVDWHQQENGLLGVAVRGERRFRVDETTTAEDGLLVGELEWLPDSAESIALPTEHLEELEKLLRELVQHPALGWVQLPESRLSASELGWNLAQVLPVSLDEKIPLLAESDSAKRLAKIQGFVDELGSL